MPSPRTAKQPVSRSKSPAHKGHKTDWGSALLSSSTNVRSATRFYDDIMKSPNVASTPDPGTCDGSAGSAAAMSRRPQDGDFQRELQHLQQKRRDHEHSCSVIGYVWFALAVAFGKKLRTIDSTSAPRKVENYRAMSIHGRDLKRGAAGRNRAHRNDRSGAACCRRYHRGCVPSRRYGAPAGLWPAGCASTTVANT